MAQFSSIEWTDSTWNPVTGCTKVSQGCKHCYAERMAKRLKAMGVERYQNGFRVTLQRDLLTEPLKWARPRMIFVNSMSDLFHEQVPLDFIQSVFATMSEAKQHIFQILTKRSHRLVELFPQLPWPENVWMGVSVETPDQLERVHQLRQVPAHVRFLSLEPLLAPIPASPLDDIHWVIVGGESGPGARPIKEDWVDDIQKQCARRKAAFFFKQWGGVRKDLTGRVLHGHIFDELPHQAFLHPSSTNLIRVSTN
jgi:protein gp37